MRSSLTLAWAASPTGSRRWAARLLSHPDEVLDLRFRQPRHQQPDAAVGAPPQPLLIEYLHALAAKRIAQLVGHRPVASFARALALRTYVGNVVIGGSAAGASSCAAKS